MEQLRGKEWYCRVSGSESGPYTWVELRRMAKAGQLTPKHQVRISTNGHDGQWLPMSRIARLLPEYTGPTEEDEHAEDSATSEAEARQLVITKGDSRSWSGGMFSSLSGGFLQPVFDFFSGAGYALTEGIGQVLWRIWVYRIPVAVVTLVLAINGGLIYWFSMESEAEQIAKVKLIAARYQQYKSRKVPDSQWTAFVADSRRQLEPMIRSLEGQASVSNPVQQHLLWLSRDCLIPMLQGPRDKDHAAEKQVASHLRQIQVKLYDRNRRRMW